MTPSDLPVARKPSDASETENAEPSAKPIEELFGERLGFENELIHQRTSWLLTLNSFLVGGSAVLIANQDKFGSGHVLTAALLVVSVVGSLSSASALFANVWGGVARRGMTVVLVEEWEKLPAKEAAARRQRMRLYGLDPRSAVANPPPKPSRFLHPGYFLPGLFVLLFAVAPFLAQRVSSSDGTLPTPLLCLPTILLVGFLLIALSDAVVRRRHERTSPPAASEPASPAEA